tara:strand:+ start:203 stop:337 length:135 start_codon:yes stop_codon:yes gene_type:complete
MNLNGLDAIEELVLSSNDELELELSSNGELELELSSNDELEPHG